MSHSSLTE